jgi:hypothetical protein
VNLLQDIDPAPGQLPEQPENEPADAGEFDLERATWDAAYRRRVLERLGRAGCPAIAPDIPPNDSGE